MHKDSILQRITFSATLACLFLSLTVQTQNVTQTSIATTKSTASPSTARPSSSAKPLRPRLDYENRGQWVGIGGDYGKKPYVWPGQPEIRGIDNNANFIALNKHAIDYWYLPTQCTLKDVSSFGASLLRWITVPLNAAPHNIVCTITGELFKRDAIVQDGSRLTPIPNYAKGWLLAGSTSSKLETGSIQLHPTSQLLRIIYEQKKNSVLEEVQKEFIKYRPGFREDQQQSLMRVVFIGTIAPGAFRAGAFNGLVNPTRRALYLQFDLVNADEALRILPQDVFGPVLKKETQEKFRTADSHDVQLVTFIPRMPRAWMAPSIASPAQNKFVVDCSHPDNQWLRNYSLANYPPDTRGKYQRYLYFWCEDGTDVNRYEKWFPNGKAPYYPLPFIPEDEPDPSIPTNTPIITETDKTNPPTPPQTPPPTSAQPVTEASGSDWWIFLLVALIIIVIVAALIMYFMLASRSDDSAPSTTVNSAAAPSSTHRSAVARAPSVGSASRFSSSRAPSSVGPRPTTRSGLSSSAQRASSVRGPSSVGSARTKRSGALSSSPTSGSRRPPVTSQSRLPSSASRSPSSAKSKSPSISGSKVSHSATASKKSPISSSSPSSRPGSTRPSSQHASSTASKK